MDEEYEIYYKKDDDGFEEWGVLDRNNRHIYYKNCRGEIWFKHDSKGNKIPITKKEYEQIKFKKKEKEFNSRTKVSRFKLMDI